MRNLARNYLEPIHTHGRCRNCGKLRWVGRGICLPCRTPVDRRALVEAGVPSGSAEALANAAKNFRAQGFKRKQVAVLLTAIHPNLMANIRVTPDDRFVLERADLHWQRRVGWVDFVPNTYA